MLLTSPSKVLALDAFRVLMRSADTPSILWDGKPTGVGHHIEEVLGLVHVNGVQ